MKAKFKTMGWFLRVITLNRIVGITLAPFGIYIKEGKSTDKLKKHEATHWAQQMELAIILFYLWYFIEWIIRLFINGKKAYYMLSFEQEARFCANNPLYKRNCWDWFLYY